MSEAGSSWRLSITPFASYMEHKVSRTSSARQSLRKTRGHAEVYEEEFPTMVHIDNITPYGGARKKGEIPFHIPHKKFLGIPLIKKPAYSDDTTEMAPMPAARSKESYGHNIVDINNLIAEMRKMREYKFIYLTPLIIEGSTGKSLTPYQYRVVSHKEVHPNYYLTLSPKGVITHEKNNENFTPLDQWEKDFKSYSNLRQIPFFRNFRLLKAFNIWCKILNWRKRNAARIDIDKILFFADGNLHQALINLKTHSLRMEHIAFPDLDITENCLLKKFYEKMMVKLGSTLTTLLEFHQFVTKIVVNACKNAVLEYEEAQYVKQIDDQPGKLYYLEQCNKKTLHLRLGRFVYLMSMMYCEVLQKVVRNSNNLFMKAVKQHMQYLPSEEFLNTPAPLCMDIPRPSIGVQQPFFHMWLKATGTGMETQPTIDEFTHYIIDILDLWMNSILHIPPLALDDGLIPIIRPKIIHKEFDARYGAGPSLQYSIAIDQDIQSNREDILRDFNTNFKTIRVYLQRLQPIQDFFEDNLNTDVEELTQETDPQNLREILKKLHFQIDFVNEVGLLQPLGLFLLHLDEFKKEILPVSKNLLQAVEESIAKIGPAKIKGLYKECSDAIAYLVRQPKKTTDFVAYLQFLDSRPARLEVISEEVDYVREVYNVVAEYNVPCPSEDLDSYAHFVTMLGRLKTLVETKLTDKDKIVQKLSYQIEKDIANLTDDINTIFDGIKQDWLVKRGSNVRECMAMLNTLSDRLHICQNEAAVLRGYQRQFALEVARFNELDSAMAELKIRQLLWESFDSWNTQVKEYRHGDFTKIVPDDVTKFVAKILKNAALCEKAIPENEITDDLKRNVNDFKERIPIMTYLRNPAMKSRHWLRVENLLNKRFAPGEVFNLASLEQCGALDCVKELEELSAQASAEAALENLLRRVENGWQNLEFGVVCHRDAKDVFILASVEDIQQVLDDSFININTILSSHHVGPIESRVKTWQKQLDLFSRTLDAWLECQTNWLYLESIFCTPDIHRQLPTEGRLFNTVDRTWKDLMRRTKENPMAMAAATIPGTLEALENCNHLIDQILKCLEAYLESKRVIFPRFYFLSNEELLEILAQTRNPAAVQPHLGKCFDAIKSLEFGEAASDGVTLDIVAMFSPEGERVSFMKMVKARGNVEDWLGKVEEMMVASLKRALKFSLIDSETKTRSQWVLSHPSQIILAASQIIWSLNVHNILEKRNDAIEGMKMFEKQNFDLLSELAGMVRGEMTQLGRAVVCALITISVHARDIISHMVVEKVASSNNFQWLKNLRYYWDGELETCIVRMSTAFIIYGYEYLGASPRLVITPLTDKCYLCLMGAMQLDLGGAPAGPAGTGKTESTKDLSKAVAVQCVVFNCSESLDFKMMGRFFSGLAQAGAWCCFDEFNRIDIEVLSVIAQQLLSIRNAKVQKLQRFMFEGREIKLMPRCSVFITMNPGYAGRTELPDNLKALFRPISMMIPDYALIAEVILYSEGFETSKILSQKMTQLYKLCSEQLSQQNHYDFGMRALKSVLVMAGHLKRAHPDVNEDIVLIRALRDSNIPKFLADDTILFQGILGDVFPGVVIPEIDYGVLERTIRNELVEAKLQPEFCIVRKTIQFYETLVVRHGVMLVGPTGGGKTTVLNTLKTSLTFLFTNEPIHRDYLSVRTHVMNPKAITIGELYGETNPFTMEWKDGILGMAARVAAQNEVPEHEWIVCDGPVDAVWIENMNTVLDDNKLLCLANSERIRFTSYMRMIFEVEDLEQASPATVSRCGMVYIDPSELQWQPFVKSWLAHKLPNDVMNDKNKKFLLSLFEAHLQPCIEHVRRNGLFPLRQTEGSKVEMICWILQALFLTPNAFDPEIAEPTVQTLIANCLLFATLWSIGGNLLEVCRPEFEICVKEAFQKQKDIRIPEDTNLWSVYINVTSRTFEPWSTILPPYNYDPETPFFDILVPTSDTVKFSQLMTKLLSVRYPVLFTGETGVGKSAIAKAVLNSLSTEGTVVPVVLTFSAQTSSARTQEMIEIRLEKKKKTMLGAPLGKQVVVFVDDVNMPALDTYGSQPPIELLRHYLNYGGFYDRDKLFWKEIKDVILCAACAPPGGGRNKMTSRFVRHFAVLAISDASDEGLTTIFQSILNGFLKDFATPVRSIGNEVVNCAINVYKRVLSYYLPSPSKCHYVFNLRDLSKCIQGILRADGGTLRESLALLRLFYHECLRTFQDRLNCFEDKADFFKIMKELCLQHFGLSIVQFDENNLIGNEPTLLFGDFINPNAVEKIYEEIKNVNKLKDVLVDTISDYNEVYSKNMKIVLFKDAIEHCCRISRTLSTDRGNGLLIGLGGMGKQTITKLASHLNDFRCCQLELTQTYDYAAFKSDVRKSFFSAGVLGKKTTLLVTDNQIVCEEFLEDINNILNSGEVPNLYEGDEMELLLQGLRSNIKDSNVAAMTPESLFNIFLGTLKLHFHLILTMSPIGDSFRRRCRLFPSLVNCCNIDWFLPWPNEALLSVAEESLSVMLEKDLKVKLSSICVTMHQSVGDMAVRLLAEKRRHFYSTPSNYIQMLNSFNSMLSSKTEEILGVRERFINGLKKLYETYGVVEIMKAELVALEPLIAKKQEAANALTKHLAKEQSAADQVRQVVLAEEAIAKVKATETQALADDAQKDLSAAMPAMNAAVKALEALNKQDIAELKVFQKPPDLVKLVMESVCLLFGVKQDWTSAKLLLGDVNFLKRLREFDKDNMKESMLGNLRTKYIEHPDFIPNKVATQSKVCKSLCMWVKALDFYAKVYKVVAPKKKALDVAEAELEEMREVLREKQRQLAEVEGQIAKLESQLDVAVADKMVVEAQVNLCAARLNRSARLTSALGDEQVRWEEQVQMYTERLKNMVGDILLSAGSVAYLGPFTADLREDLLVIWSSSCSKINVPVSEHYNLVAILSDAYEVRTWTALGLPRDAVSADNGVLVTRSLKAPLMIDPQGQANRWIRGLEGPRNLRVLRPGESLLLNHMTAAVRAGEPVLLEDVGEKLDPALEPLLLNQTFTQMGVLMIHLGDSDVEYNKGFKLYLTTKLSNPHYLPETCIMVNLINFTVTVAGIEDQLLADVVRLERPDLETQRTELITRINSGKQQLKNIEEKILRMLFHASGNILDDEELIDALNESKETTEVTAARVEEAEATEKRISLARNRYRPVATRGAIVYSVISELPMIDPMYQYSLAYITQVFCAVLQFSKKNPDVDERVRQLMKEITFSIYTNVARGIFERHKLVFSFMVCMTIYLFSNHVTRNEWNFFLFGPIGAEDNVPKNPYADHISQSAWASIFFLSTHFQSMKGLDKNFPQMKITIGDLVVPNPINASNPAKLTWIPKLTDFEKLMIIKAAMEDQLLSAVTEYVRMHLGPEFLESPSVTLANLFQDTSKTTPLVFVLSPGADPFAAVQKFAIEKNFNQKFFGISLGQGQGPIAEKMLNTGGQKGEWIFFQNCHLASSWMPTFERKYLNLCENQEKVHNDFRLFLSAMPFQNFPTSILQNAVKITNEPPRGLRANVKRALIDITKPFFENSPLKGDWRKLIFGICFFHGFILERRNFGPLGWNIPYEFNDNDRGVALTHLKMFCVDAAVPWDALEYTTGEITYGGRVTDPWDLRCLKTALKNFFSPKILQAGYKFSKSGIYYCPESPTCKTLVAYKKFVDTFPINESAEVFGMSEYANTAYKIREGQNLLNAILEVQPRESSGGGAGTDELVLELSSVIQKQLASNIDVTKINQILLKTDANGRVPPLKTVLMQEIERYNKLLKIISTSLKDLKRAVKGEIVFSDQLEEVYRAMQQNKVPKIWGNAAYPSLKTLHSWVRDLELRIEFMKTWLQNGQPPSFWLSGFIFPQGFLTAVLQTQARKTNIPIDALKFHFVLNDQFLSQANICDNIAKGKTVAAAYENIAEPPDGVLIHGLFLEAGRWDYASRLLIEPRPTDSYCALPAIWFNPKNETPDLNNRYVCPLYKTAGRAGTLSTTGTSTNFVLPVHLPTNYDPSFWILMGTAMLSQLSD